MLIISYGGILDLLFGTTLEKEENIWVIYVT